MRASLFAMVTCVALVACGSAENRAVTLDLEVQGNVLTLNGIINSRALGQFEDVMADNPQVTTVVLADLQGSTDDQVVVEMGYRIRERGLATRLLANSQVFSGGVDLFLAGTQRTIAQGAVVGVHEWDSGVGSAREFARDSWRHEPTRGYIADMLGSDAFYWFTVEAAAFDDVHIMSRAEMARYGLMTQ